MSLIRFTIEGGETYEVDADWNRLIPNLQTRGIRVFRPVPGVLIPVDKIVLIEDITPEEPEEVKEPEFGDMKTSVDTTGDMPEYPEEKQDEQADTTEPPMSVEEKKEAILKEMKEMSECAHESHDIYFQEIMVGKGANRKAQKRYFPVCAKCGVRERYVKADSLSDDDKANAKLWDK